MTVGSRLFRSHSLVRASPRSRAPSSPNRATRGRTFPLAPTRRDGDRPPTTDRPFDRPTVRLRIGHRSRAIIDHRTNVPTERQTYYPHKEPHRTPMENKKNKTKKKQNHTRTHPAGSIGPSIGPPTLARGTGRSHPYPRVMTHHTPPTPISEDTTTLRV